METIQISPEIMKTLSVLLFGTTIAGVINTRRGVLKTLFGFGMAASVFTGASYFAFGSISEMMNRIYEFIPVEAIQSIDYEALVSQGLQILNGFMGYSPAL